MGNKAAKIFMTVILAIVAVCGVVAIVKSTKNSDPTLPEKPAETVQVNATETPQATTKSPVTLKMLSVGDNLIHDGIYEQAHKRTGGKGYDFSFAYKRIAKTVGEADIATINEESPIVPSREPSGYPLFNAPGEVGEEIINIGFDVVTLANNHMLDKTAKGLAETIDWWDSHENIVRTGAYKDLEDMNRLEYIEKNGIKIGLVGITQYTNGLSLPEGSPLKIIYSKDEDIIKSKIETEKKECDVVLVNVHWGNEYTNTPTDWQYSLAKKMASWGADIIIGHHPHVIQPVEWIENENGSKTLVAYSLGNFISQQNTPARVVGGMLHYDVTKDFESDKTTVSNVRFEPIVTHYVRGVDDVEIYPASEYTDALAKKQRARLKDNTFSTSYIKEYVAKVIDAEFLA